MPYWEKVRCVIHQKNYHYSANGMQIMNKILPVWQIMCDSQIKAITIQIDYKGNTIYPIISNCL